MMSQSGPKAGRRTSNQPNLASHHESRTVERLKIRKILCDAGMNLKYNSYFIFLGSYPESDGAKGLNAVLTGVNNM